MIHHVSRLKGNGMQNGPADFCEIPNWLCSTNTPANTSTMTSPPIPTEGETPVAVVAPQNPNDIEESGNVYRPGGCHPVYIGDVYNDRYKVLNKIGYGVYSTVWLVKDLQHE